jgi:hypothetical protein
MMETLLEATARLRAAGFTLDFDATGDGYLRCRACGLDHAPEGMRVAEIVRYEGASDPDDQAILLAFCSRCGRRGLYSAGYGPGAAVADVEALRRLPHVA